MLLHLKENTLKHLLQLKSKETNFKILLYKKEKLKEILYKKTKINKNIVYIKENKVIKKLPYF